MELLGSHHSKGVKHRIASILIILLISCNCLFAQLKGNYTLNPNGSGARNYTSVKNLIKDLDSLGIKDTARVSISPGTYSDQFKLANFNRSKKGFLIIDGLHRDSVIFNFRTSTGWLDFEGIFDFHVSSGVQIKNLTCDISSTQGYGIAIWDTASNYTIENIKIKAKTGHKYNKTGGIHLRTKRAQYPSAENISILDCHISNVRDGVTIYLGNNSTKYGKNFNITNTILEKCSRIGFTIRGIENLQVINNKVIRPDTANLPLPYGYTSYQQGNCTKSVVSGNLIADYEYCAYVIYDENINSNNQSYFINNVAAGVNIIRTLNGLASLRFTRVNNLKVFHNSVLHQSEFKRPKSSVWTTGVINIQSAIKLEFTNNIVQVLDKTTQSHPLLIDSSYKNCSISNNNFYHPKGLIAIVDSTHYNSLNNLSKVAFAAFDENRTDTINFEGSTPKLSTTKANPRGNWVGVELDADGVTRCRIAPSLGAYESSVNAPTSGPFTPGFKAPDSLYLGVTNLIVNANDSINKVHEWFVNAKKVSDNTHLSFIPSKSGRYEIKLVTTSCFKRDSVTDTLAIYCKPKIDTPNNNYISSFELNGTTNKSGSGVNGYTNYRNSVDIELHNFTKYSFTIKRDGDTTKPANYSVWVDFNFDGNFANSELVAQLDSSKTGVWSDTIFIDTTRSFYADLKTRIRIGITDIAKSRNSCETYTSGEFEDYGLTIKNIPSHYQIHIIGGDTSIEQCSKWTDPGAYGSSVFRPFIPLHSTAGLVDVSRAGTYLIEYSIKDPDGNKFSKMRKIIVKPDSFTPTFTLLGANPLVYGVGRTFIDPGYTAIDNCDGNINHQVKISSNLNTGKLGTYGIKYRVEDKNGNADSLYRTVVLKDFEAPKITSAIGDNPLTLFVFENYIEQGFNWTDNYYSVVKDSITGIVNSSKLGSYTLTYYAIDSSKNISLPYTRTVNVVDTVKPDIGFVSDPNKTVTVQVFEKYIVEKYTARDNYSPPSYLDSNIAFGGSYFKKFGSNTANTIGNYTFVYIAKDEAGNSDSITRKIEVVDTIAPKATLDLPKGYVELPRWFSGNLMDEIKLKPTDNYWNSSTLTWWIDENLINVQSLGSYHVIVSVQDPSKNVKYKRIRVDVVNTQQTTGIDKNGKNFSVYPNPTSGIIYLELLSNQNQELRLYNAQGKLLEHFNQAPNRIDLSPYGEGIYFLELKLEQEIIRKKLVKY